MSNQKPRTIDEQIRLLRSRGMAFGDEEGAKQCLAHISYFRLKSDNQIKDKLLALIDHSTNIPYYKYGFTGDWRKEPIWR